MVARRTFLWLGGAAIATSPMLLSTGTAAPKPRPPAIFIITMKDMKFGFMPSGLHVGDAIEWVNEDIFLHTATAMDKSFDVVLKPKAKGRTVLKAAGSIPFVCRYHPGMKGVLSVAT